ncbi:hypothetical protein P7K49_005701, partial [Saguinus oedipus]
DSAAQWGRGIHHNRCNPPLLKYCLGLMQPAIAEATCHNRENSTSRGECTTAEQSPATAGQTHASR